METIGLVIVAVITAVIGPAVMEYIKLRFKSKEQITDPIKREVKYTRVINDEIEDIRELFKGDRVWIVMYHNGGNFLSHDKSMKKFSMMYENCKSGVPTVAHTFTNLPVSLYTRATEEILTKKHIYIPDYSDPSVPTFGLRGAGESTGAKSSYSVGLFDIQSENCIGILGIDFIRKKSLNEDQIHILNERTQRIAGYLSNYLLSK